MEFVSTMDGLADNNSCWVLVLVAADTGYVGMMLGGKDEAGLSWIWDKLSTTMSISQRHTRHFQPQPQCCSFE